MKARLYHGFPEALGTGVYRLELESVIVGGLAAAVANKVVISRYSRRIPANDRDSYRW